ncbi:hypothetical protein BD809_10664 [Aquimarina intermedia]|uniref:Uncharacterized protein n=1 Tax=Aquimarina intermedia TaxID=350814 RepID=A0A5S5C315_9FLAO|nr:hypothetical protein BD809_10664 [Aquimarina intermedia]
MFGELLDIVLLFKQKILRKMTILLDQGIIELIF